MYEIEVAPAAHRDFTKLKSKIHRHDLDRLREAINNLAEDPRPQGTRKIVGSEGCYRIRVGDYRIVYEVDDRASLVVLLQVKRRTETTYS